MTAHLVASYQTDLTLAISWLRLNKAVSKVGDIEKNGLVYTCSLRLSKPKKEVADLVSAKFGRFVRLR